MQTNQEIERKFTFLTERGFVFERDYSKGTDSTCTLIYRFRKDGANYLEFRVLTERERNTVVCVDGQKKFPSLPKKYAAFIRKWKLQRLFQKSRKDVWQLNADVCREEIARTGTLFGIMFLKRLF